MKSQRKIHANNSVRNLFFDIRWIYIHQRHFQIKSYFQFCLIDNRLVSNRKEISVDYGRLVWIRSCQMLSWICFFKSVFKGQRSQMQRKTNLFYFRFQKLRKQLFECFKWNPAPRTYKSKMKQALFIAAIFAFTQAKSSQNVVVGSLNKVSGKKDTVVGHKNNVYGVGLNVKGNSNKVKGLDSTVIGHHNTLSKGKNTGIAGHKNNVAGSYSRVVGNHNKLNGNSSLILGSGNKLKGNGDVVKGNKNTLTSDVCYNGLV